jgi:hypothetical protein
LVNQGWVSNGPPYYPIKNNIMNQAITGDREFRDFKYPLYSARYRLLGAALVAGGFAEDRYACLKPLCNDHKKVIEHRKAEFVQFYIEALALGVNLDTVPDICQCGPVSCLCEESPGAFVIGSATLITALAGNNNDLKFSSRTEGPAGNLITVAYVNAGASQTLAVTVTGNAISVRLATNGSSVITSTAAQIRTAIQAQSQANGLVAVALAPNNNGQGIVTALAATALTGGY